MNILLYNPNPKLFWKKKGVFVYLEFRFATPKVMKSNCFKQIRKLAVDIEENCSDASDLDENKRSYPCLVTYIGFNSEEDARKAVQIIKENPDVQRKLTCKVYKEGDSLINVSNDTEDMFLFYNSI